MLSKEKEPEELAYMPQWKVKRPRFFEVETKKESSMEYLELNEFQTVFLQRFYAEYAEKDPFAVLNWLHRKALAFQEDMKEDDETGDGSSDSDSVYELEGGQSYKMATFLEGLGIDYANGESFDKMATHLEDLGVDYTNGE